MELKFMDADVKMCQFQTAGPDSVIYVYVWACVFVVSVLQNLVFWHKLHMTPVRE